MANILDILTRAQALRQETALNSITPDRAGGIMYDTLILINQMQLEGGSLLISKVYSSVAAMEADTTPTSDLTGRALRPGQLAVIVPSSSTSSDMGSVYRYNEPGSWTLCGKIGGLPMDTVPTQGSSNGITSGAVYTALSALKNEGYKYMGIATPGSGGTAPGTPNQPVFYIAGPGSYPNFGSITVASGYLGFIKYSGGSWTVESVAVGKDYDEQISQLQQEVTADISQLEANVDGLPSIGDTQEDGFYLTDENGEAILQLKRGNIRTKNFDSGGSVPLISNDDSDADLNVVDSAGNVILKLSGGHLKTKRFDSETVENPFANLHIICLGDSITWYGGDDCTGDRGWTKWFKAKAKPKSMRSFARSGATLTSQATSTVDIEDYSSSRNAKNVAYNQLARVSAAYAGTPSSHDEVLTDAPDIVFLAFGTNDLTVDSVYDETPASEFDGVTTFATYSINQLLTIAKAMRYICEQLYVLFPDTQIVCIAPQQQAYNEASGKKNSSGYLALGDLFEQCCDFLSINCIRLDKHCGTYDIREIVEDHKFPSGDHQHPNALGARENGYYIFNQVKTFLKY